MTSEGRVASVDLSQKAVRLPAEDLSAAVVVAVNRGWDALAATMREKARTQAAGSWDPTRFIALQQAAAIRTGALIDKLASMNDAAGRIPRAAARAERVGSPASPVRVDEFQADRLRGWPGWFHAYVPVVYPGQRDFRRSKVPDDLAIELEDEQAHRVLDEPTSPHDLPSAAWFIVGRSTFTEDVNDVPLEIGQVGEPRTTGIIGEPARLASSTGSSPSSTAGYPISAQPPTATESTTARTAARRTATCQSPALHC